MRTYSGRLWLVRDQHSEVGVEIGLDEERVRITSNGILIGDWPFEDVDIRRRGDDIHLFAEDEELGISSEDRGFSRAMLSLDRPERTLSSRESEERAPGSSSNGAHLQEDAAAEDPDEAEQEQRARRRNRRGAHREPWSLKLRW